MHGAVRGYRHACAALTEALGECDVRVVLVRCLPPSLPQQLSLSSRVGGQPSLRPPYGGRATAAPHAAAPHNAGGGFPTV